MLLAKGLTALQRRRGVARSIRQWYLGIVARVRDHFLRRDGQARELAQVWKSQVRDRGGLAGSSSSRRKPCRGRSDVLLRFRRDLNVLVSRGVWRLFEVADAEYRRTLDAHALLDFSDRWPHAWVTGPDESSHRAGTVSSRDTTMCWWTSFRTQSRSVESDWPSRPVMGRGGGPCRRRTSRPFHFHRLRSIDLRLCDADVSVFQEAGRFLEGLLRTAMFEGRFRAATDWCRRCSPSSTTSAMTWKRPPRAATPSVMTSKTAFRLAIQETGRKPKRSVWCSRRAGVRRGDRS